MLNWDAIGAIGEVVGGVAVIATLLYLAVQIRQNARSVRNAASLSVNEGLAEINRRVSNDPEFADLWQILAGPAVERIEKSVLKELIVTDSIPLNSGKRIGKITQISVAPLLAEAIHRIHSNESVSSLFSKAGVEA